ncbi:hypothetical protein [Paraburkholderia lycopersici]|uniref:Uncharacterized protein n=1 Tax=Paraburkholderia lycopersici TaxID=416944 RepID=A0A1G6PFG5_9BURK|nr:hypothetical protein [Paraburkholderia lycopersici]SDC78266.1 hypothetical protein SAMN05421548_110112 [Paraburkholderia lycopersici]
MSAWEITKKVLKYTNPTASLLTDAVELAAKAVSSASEKGAEPLREEIAKQNLQLQFAQHQARVAQELAIARRIDSAEEVEIEEFYDASGKGQVGLSVDAEATTGTLGLGGEGRKVTKRIYRFKGLHAEAEKIYNQMLASDENPA